MSSSLVKLFPKYKYIGARAEDIPYLNPTADMMGALVPGKFTLIGGREEGREVTETVQLNQVVKITPAIPISSKKYTVLVSYNPALAEYGSVSCPAILPPGEEISLTVKAFRNFEIDEFVERYCFIIYAID